jgi:rod shape-determining protein MreC
MVGRVEKFELNEGSNFYSVKVKLSTDFANMNYVYVVNPLMRAEVDSLKAKTKSDE